MSSVLYPALGLARSTTGRVTYILESIQYLSGIAFFILRRHCTQSLRLFKTTLGHQKLLSQDISLSSWCFDQSTTISLHLDTSVQAVSGGAI